MDVYNTIIFKHAKACYYPNRHTYGVRSSFKLETINQPCKSLTPFAWLATLFNP